MTLTKLLRTQGVTAPAGFRAAGIPAGIKKSGAPDLALVFNEGPDYAAAGVFTRNQVKAAPVLWSQQVLTTGRLRAVLLNSGGANACTGPVGFQDTHASAEAVAAALSDWGTETGPIEVAVCSTGLIGDRLPMERVLAGITEIVHELGGGLTGGEAAARAIMTTDTVPKQVALHHAIAPAENWTVGGMAKGAGCWLRRWPPCWSCSPPTPSPMPPPWTPRCAGPPRERSTASTSTAAAPPTTPCCCWRRAPARSGPVRTISTARCWPSAMTCARNCRPTRRVTKRIAVTVTGAPSEDDAVTAARVIARDSLVKTALFGSDPNWGRVLAAGAWCRSPSTPIGSPCRSTARRCASTGPERRVPGTSTCPAPDIDVTVDLNVGPASATIRTTDLSHAYVEENSAYSS